MSEPAGRPGFIPQEEYDRIRSLVPIACVDVLAARDRPGSGREVLLIRRSERGRRQGWALVGGRIEIDEPVSTAAQRHVSATLGARVRVADRDWSAPDALAEYERISDREAKGTFDPDQHSIALNYVVALEGSDSVEPRGEAVEARWFRVAELPGPDEVVFGQHELICRLAGA